MIEHFHQPQQRAASALNWKGWSPPFQSPERVSVHTPLPVWMLSSAPDICLRVNPDAFSSQGPPSRAKIPLSWVSGIWTSLIQASTRVFTAKHLTNNQRSTFPGYSVRSSLLKMNTMRTVSTLVSGDGVWSFSTLTHLFLFVIYPLCWSHKQENYHSYRPRPILLYPLTGKSQLSSK